MPSPPSIPKPPSPQATADAQIQVNRQGALDFATLTGIGQQTPFGSMDVQTTGVDANGLPIRRVVTNLSPQQQALLNLIQGSGQIAGQQGQNLLTNAAYGGVPDLSTAAGSVVDTNLQRFLTRLTPFHNQQTEQLDNQLRNQGLMPGTEAYDRALRTLRDNQFQQVQGYLSQMEPEAFKQATQAYTLPLTTAQTLIGMGQPASLTSSLVQPPANQQFTPPQMNAIQQTANQANQFGYNAALANQNALLQGITSIGMAGLPFLLSDEELKQDIEPVGKTFDNQNIYRYTYKGDPTNTTHIGLIAQEVEKIKPSAVREFGGYKAVDYHAATNRASRLLPFLLD